MVVLFANSKVGFFDDEVRDYAKVATPREVQSIVDEVANGLLILYVPRVIDLSDQVGHQETG